MNAPIPLGYITAAAHAAPQAQRLREIPYNYNSFFDREIVIRTLGARIPRGRSASPNAPT